MADESTMHEVDSWRFAGSMLKNMLGRAFPAEASHPPIPWTPVEKPLSECKVALPLDRLRELVGEGVVGSMAETHYSIMGFQGSDSSRLENESAPAIAEIMCSEEVDLALLAPV